VASRLSDGSVAQIMTSAPNGPWGAWNIVANGATGDPVITNTLPGGLEIYFRGLANDLRVCRELPGGGLFGPSESLGGSPAIFTRPAIARVADTVFAFVRRDDGTIRVNTRRTGAGTWTGWINLGESTSFEPAARRNSDGSVDVFAVRTDGMLMVRRIS
jgi:hypothetical protein